MHLIFNLIFQLLLGIPLEMVHKWWRMGIVYSLGVIAGKFLFCFRSRLHFVCNDLNPLRKARIVNVELICQLVV